MTETTKNACWVKTAVFMFIAFLSFFSASTTLEKYLYFPAALWIVLGVAITALWGFERHCRFDKTDRKTHDCSACGVFGHKLPWMIIIGAGLGNVVGMSTGWSAASAYGVAVALFSLTGSFFMMRLSEE